MTRIVIRIVRRKVFVVEQNIPESLEWDGRDDTCKHALALNEQDMAVGTARLLEDGHIGRMAVLPSWRHQGIAGAMLELLIDEARRLGMKRLELSSQQHAVVFYSRFGFRSHGKGHVEAGIPHQNMTLNL